MLFFVEGTSKENALLIPYSCILRSDWKSSILKTQSKHGGVVKREATEMPHRLHKAIMGPLVGRALGWLTTWRGRSCRSRTGCEVWKDRIRYEALSCLFPGLILAWLGLKHFHV